MIANENHVLVVDDEEQTRTYLLRQLRQYTTVAAVKTGSEAIALLKTQPFDLVLLDILMPEMNGFQVLEAIKSEPSLSHIPVVMISGLNDLDSLVQCVELGAEDYLFKPLNPVLLKARINACLERKHLRSQEQAYLEQLKAEKLAAESANRAKSTFLAGISHELRTPLNAIIGYSEILQEDLREIAAEFIPDLEKICSSGKNLLEIINDILDISKIEAGKMELSLETFSIPALVNSLVIPMQPLVQQGGNILKIDCPEDIGAMHADMGKVRQILLNLLSNAAKFTSQGRITLRVERSVDAAAVSPRVETGVICEEREVRSEERGARSHEGQSASQAFSQGLPTLFFHAGDCPESKSQDMQGVALIPTSPHSASVSSPAFPRSSPQITFQVSDTGIGIEPEQMQRLFQIFHQGDDVINRKHGGIGLGLALSQRFCQMMGGVIAVESVPGQGSTFTVHLPMDVVDQQPIAVLPPPETTELATAESMLMLSAKEQLVLVVDGDRNVRDIMVATLNQQGYRVITTWSSQEGLRLARELRPHLIILGMVAASVDSWMVLSTLKADPELADIPVVMVAISHDQGHGFTLGVVESLTNPTDFKRLVMLLQRYRHNCPEQADEQILLVQAETPTRQMVQRLLEKEGWAIAATGNTHHALEKVKQTKPAFILLDLMSLNVRGLNFLADLRRHPDTHSIPVVIMTTQDLSKSDCLSLSSYIETLFQRYADNRDNSLIEVARLVRICISQDCI